MSRPPLLPPSKGVFGSLEYAGASLLAGADLFLVPFMAYQADVPVAASWALALHLKQIGGTAYGESQDLPFGPLVVVLVLASSVLL